MQKERKKETPLTLLINLLFTAASLLIAMPLALSLQKAAVNVFLDTVFASYLNTLTPGMILFAFLFFAFDGIYGTLHFYNFRERTAFLQKRNSEVMILAELPRVIFSLEFPIEAALFAAACYFSPVYSAVHFPLLLAICALRKAAVRRKWYLMRRKSAEKKWYRVLGVLFKNIVLLAAQIWLIIIFMPMVFPYFWIIIKQYKVIANILLLVFLVFFSCIYARAMKKRNDFIKKLRTLCEEKGFELSEISGKYSFIFGRKSGASFTVKAHGKAYSCKFLASKVKIIPMVFGENGEGAFHYSIRLRGIQLLNKYAYFEYGFEAAEGERKILICLPMPAKIFLRENGRGTIPISSGATLWEYKLFTASNFLRCLEWNAVEK